MDQTGQPQDKSADHPAPETGLATDRHDRTSTLEYWAHQQGKAYQAAFDEAALAALASGQKTIGDMHIRFLIRNAVGMYYLEEGQLVWEEPSDFRLQIVVAVCDARDLRFIPNLEVYVTLFDQQYNELGDHLHTFLWDPAFFHYGRNWNASPQDTFTLRVGVELPSFPRHNQAEGKRYARPEEAEFRNVKLIKSAH